MLEEILIYFFTTYKLIHPLEKGIGGNGGSSSKCFCSSSLIFIFFNLRICFHKINDIIQLGMKTKLNNIPKLEIKKITIPQIGFIFSQVDVIAKIKNINKNHIPIQIDIINHNDNIKIKIYHVLLFSSILSK